MNRELMVVYFSDPSLEDVLLKVCDKREGLYLGVDPKDSRRRATYKGVKFNRAVIGYETIEDLNLNLKDLKEVLKSYSDSVFIRRNYIIQEDIPCTLVLVE
jgi:hypothetical protein